MADIEIPEYVEESHTKESFFGTALAALVLFVPLIFLEGWAVSLMWNWFVAPLGIVEIGVLHGAELAFTIALITHQFNMDVLKWPKKYLSYAIYSPLLMVGIGWVINALM